MNIFSLVVVPASERENLYNYIYLYIKKYCLSLGNETKPPLQTNSIIKYRITSVFKNVGVADIVPSLIVDYYIIKFDDNKIVTIANRLRIGMSHLNF